MITLSAFARRYVERRPVCCMRAATMLRRAAALESAAGTTLLPAVLTEEIVNRFLRSLDRSPWTIRDYRGDFLALWNSAADEDLLPYPVGRRIYRPSCPQLVVECYAVDEARAILHAARSLAGVYPNGVLRRDYWTAAILVGWDSGFRRGDILRLRRDAVRPDGALRVVQSKTGAVIETRLRPSTVAALDAIRRPLPLAWPLDLSWFGRHFARLVKSAGVNRGTFRWLRRASGSYVEAAAPGCGHKHLGHAAPATFSRHYDARLAGPAWELPPEL